MSTNIVICFDGTNNEPEHGQTNVARIYDIAAKNTAQVVYYDPGVGTMGARSATTRPGQALSRLGGLAFGHGIKNNIAEAYGFLMNTYQPGDQIYVFGFSRGAYTARALVGMLRTVGLLRPGADNLIPYALKLYARNGSKKTKQKDREKFFALTTRFDKNFGNPDFPDRFAPQIQFLGVWDTVKFVGWFNLRARFEQAHWPFTRKVPNVVHGRHAMAIHERRRYYKEYRFDEQELTPTRDLHELWFSGVHSDVGGQFPDDHRLSDIALKWMVDEAVAHGLVIDAETHERHLLVKPTAALPDDYAMGRIHKNGLMWFAAGAGWHKRRIRESDECHPSVAIRESRETKL
jgi:uncharacterized protein (DUF2235 family)